MYKESFIVDNLGNRVAVMIPVKEYDKICEALEELKDIKAYDLVKGKNEPVIPLREAIKLRKQKNG